MTAVELDPLFVRALKLLQSKSKDAADQLKQMHDDVISQRKFGVQEKKIEEFKESSRSVDRGSHKKEVEFLKLGDTEKRSLDSLKHDSIETNPAKKLKSDFGYSLQKLSESNRSGREPEKEQEHAQHKEQGSEKAKERVKMKLSKDREERMVKKEEVKRAVAVISSTSSEEEDNSDTEEESPSLSKDAHKLDTEDFGLDMDDIACVVCKQFNVTSVNRLVECQECHSLYHQECHRPPVTSKNVSDPRFVWYCSRCSKNLKKMVSKPLKTKPAPFQFTKDPLPANKTKLDHSLQQAFRRVDTTKSSLLKESTARPMKGLQGMASLAANLSGKLGSDSTKHPKGESKFLVSTAKADTVKPSLAGKSDTSKFNTSAFSRLDAPKNPSSFGTKLDASKPRPGEPAKVVKSSSSSSTGRMSQSSMMSADKRFALMKKKAQKKINDRKSSLK